ncbi:3-deoxy-7-phosphoheptulonate synthase [Bartonella bilalgolemii]|uniref:3-deoxy-7-phosphoheptulonate synthase n=1 Tax=Bartonella bilalgolemii TaxID=2942911 RepID=UPI0032DEF10F
MCPYVIEISDRTRQLSHICVEYCRSLKNFIGLKCNLSINSDEFLKLIDILNSVNQVRLSLIVCFSDDRV